MSFGTFNKYIFTSIYNYFDDHNIAMHLVVNTSIEGVNVPYEYVRDNKIVLNIYPSAISKLEIDDFKISFKARFSGIEKQLVIPYHSMETIVDPSTGQMCPLYLFLSCYTPSIEDSLHDDTKENDRFDIQDQEQDMDEPEQSGKKASFSIVDD